MTIFNNFISKIDNNRISTSLKIPLALKDISDTIYGLQRGRYDLYIGDSGIGITSYVIYNYIFNAYEHTKDYKKINLKILLFTLDSKEDIIADIICMKLFKDHKIIVDPAYILNRANTLLSDTIYAKIKQLDEYITKLLEYTLFIYDTPMKPSDIRNIVTNYAEDNGKVINGKYIPRDPNDFVIIITDKLNTLSYESNTGVSNIYSTIDLHSNNCKNIYKNLYNYLVVNTLYVNKYIQDLSKIKLDDAQPRLSDIKFESLQTDTNLIFSLYDPKRYMNALSGLEQFMGYNIQKLRDRFRAINILRNTNGRCNQRKGLIFLGECGVYQELIKADKMTDEKYQEIENYVHYKYTK
jgi:hypothetical protein